MITAGVWANNGQNTRQYGLRRSFALRPPVSGEGKRTLLCETSRDEA